MERDELIAKEMAEYADGAYADHGSARNQLERFASLVAAAALVDYNKKEQIAIRNLLENDDYELRRYLEAAAIRALD